MNEYIKGEYVSLHNFFKDEEDLAALLDTAQRAIFTECPHAIENLKSSWDDNIRILRAHHSDGHIFFDLHYHPIGQLRAYVGEVQREYIHNSKHTSLELHNL